jgi:hypothetical protein
VWTMLFPITGGKWRIISIKIRFVFLLSPGSLPAGARRLH